MYKRRFRRRKFRRKRRLILYKPEYKYKDYIVNNLNPDYNGDIGTFANDISQGTDVNTRIGDAIFIKNLTLRGTIHSSIDVITRFIFFYSKEINITDAADLLETNANPNGINSPKKYQNRFETKIIFDRKITISNKLSGNKNFRYILKVNKHTSYVPGTINIKHGYLKLLTISNLALPATQINYYARLTYTDK